MNATRKWVFALLGLGILAVLAAAVAGGRAHEGKLRFLLWRTVSGKAHGGRLIAVNGIMLHYETFGHGPPVLVLHEGLGSADDMRNQIEALASRHFVIAPDLRGNGRSGDTAEPLSYEAMARDLLVLLDALSIPRADIVGWSDGGIVGLVLAMHDPARVGRLVVIGANFDPEGLARLPALPDEPAGARKVVALWRTQPHYTPALLGTIHAATLVIAGEFDVVRRAHTDALVRAIPGAQEYIIPGADHRAPLTHPDLVNGRILAFLGDTTR